MQRKKRAGLRWPRLDFGQPEGGVKESVRGLKGVSVPVEPNEAFLARLRDFHAWIEVCVCACVSPLLPPEARPERRIAIVAHWGVFYALLGGKSLRNCELHQCTELLADPLAPPG